MPTRVIDVQNDPPRLFLTRGAKDHGVALSYCWGKSKQVPLTLENIKEFQKVLPFEEMPNTAQDAPDAACGMMNQDDGETCCELEL